MDSAAEGDLVQPQLVDDVLITVSRVTRSLSTYICGAYMICFSNLGNMRIFFGTTLLSEAPTRKNVTIAPEPGIHFNQTVNLRINHLSFDITAALNIRISEWTYEKLLHESLDRTITGLKPAVLMCEVDGMKRDISQEHVAIERSLEGTLLRRAGNVCCC
ncbi:hypothetical protein N7451_001210 [Penicillium sp. IBT 35674x]|nr:hypothetical protein N7451_001210 [Penicillium sp. IBT 35674x]